jgi:hypothetical protein
MIIKYYSFVDQSSREYELKKRWRKGFQCYAEYGFQSSLASLGYTFYACFNEYIFRKEALALEAAEILAYNHYLKVRPRLCKKNHKKPRNCEKRSYTNGCGFCKTCGLFVSNVFPIEQFCCDCGVRTNWWSYENKWWCEKCKPDLQTSS